MIFGGKTSGRHRALADVCQEILAGDTAGYERESSRGFAWNLMHDARVNSAWAESWYYKHGSPASPSKMRDSLADYYGSFRTDRHAAFAALANPADAVISRHSPEAPEPNELLVHVLDLWNYGARVIWQYGADRRIGKLRSLSGMRAEAGTPPPPLLMRAFEDDGQNRYDVLDAFFLSQRSYLSEVSRRRARGDAMDSLGPMWATRHVLWQKTAAVSAEDCCSSVGLSKKKGSWITSVCYPAGRAFPLIRPTQLEAGWFGRHFPTPAACLREKGGRIVEGRDIVCGKPDHVSLPEYFHAPIDLDLDGWFIAGTQVASTAVDVGVDSDLPSHRSEHWNSLNRDFDGVPNWMPSANAP